MRSTAFLILFVAPAFGQPKGHPNYEDDVRPIFARYCFTCHNAGEMRAGLNLESFSGVLRGGGSGDVIVPGRPAASLLFKAVSHEEGAPQMPLGLPKLADGQISIIREWIQQGLLENATSQPRGAAGASLEFTALALNRPQGPPAMPESLPVVDVPDTPRANPVTALAASPWAPLVAVSGHGRIDLFDLSKRAPAGRLAFPEGIPYCLRFSRDGSMLLAAGGKPVQSGKAVLFDVRTSKRLAVLGNEMDIALAADVSADGKLIALGGPGKIVRVFSVTDGNQLYEIKKHTDWITTIEFSPDGKLLATGDRGGGIFLWESTRGGNAGNLAEHKDSITSLSWRGDGKVLASGSEDGQIIIWNVADGFPAATIAKAHVPKAAPNTYGVIPGGVLSLQFTADGRLVSVGRDSMLKLWSGSGALQSSSPAWSALLTKAAASFDGKLMVAGDYLGRLLVWDGRQFAEMRAGILQIGAARP